MRASPLFQMSCPHIGESGHPESHSNGNRRAPSACRSPVFRPTRSYRPAVTSGPIAQNSRRHRNSPVIRYRSRQECDRLPRYSAISLGRPCRAQPWIQLPRPSQVESTPGPEFDEPLKLPSQTMRRKQQRSHLCSGGEDFRNTELA